MTKPPLEPSPPSEDTVLTANALKAMAHPLRWKIICTLGERELSVGEIVERAGTTQSNISQHLMRDVLCPANLDQGRHP